MQWSLFRPCLRGRRTDGRSAWSEKERPESTNPVADLENGSIKLGNWIIHCVVKRVYRNFSLCLASVRLIHTLPSFLLSRDLKKQPWRKGTVKRLCAICQSFALMGLRITY
ncbi:hypothetical protein L2E82_34112 [Cichorium intybus]|uniref:Uncharacterized protein n=1 Tax=Cichorium intybus TaxID=13427 RepID=A0ACB9BLM0_CICIN|nr:hypothetical protein L2E82_34112 [Cichorium intybus]